jgi:hypothetical protein
VTAIVQPIVECNGVQVGNGGTCLWKMVFGDPTEPHHCGALHIVAQTQEAIAAVLGRNGLFSADDAATTARIVSAIMFLSMAVTADPTVRVEAIVQEVSTQIRLLLPADAKLPDLSLVDKRAPKERCGASLLDVSGSAEGDSGPRAAYRFLR